MAIYFIINLNSYFMIALFTGSFDPFTFGHLEVVSQAFQKFTDLDKLIINVGSNPQKSSFYPVDRRVKIIKDTILGYPFESKITVIAEEGLTVDVAAHYKVDILVRGIRPGSNDLAHETKLAQMNQSLAKVRGFDLPTEFIAVTNDFLQSISSTNVKYLLQTGEFILLSNMVSSEFLCEEIKEHFASVCISAFSPNANTEYSHFVTLLSKEYQNRIFSGWLQIGIMLNMLKIYYNKMYGCFSEEEHLNKFFAIGWHRFIQQKDRGDNETQSFYTLVRVVGDWDEVIGTKVSFTQVRSMIAATAPGAQCQTTHEKLIADLSNVILGIKIQPVWEHYIEDIREENCELDDKEYAAERIAYLQMLQNQERIYHLDWFYNTFEQQARAHIQQEITHLSNFL